MVPEVVGGIEGAVGGAVSTGITKTLPSLAAGATAGCIVGVTAYAVGNDLAEKDNTVGGTAGACAGGAVADAAGYGLGRLGSAARVNQIKNPTNGGTVI